MEAENTKMDGYSSQGLRNYSRNDCTLQPRPERCRRTGKSHNHGKSQGRIIAEFKLDKRLWMELAEMVVYLKNRSPTSTVASTPYELWHSTARNLSHLKIIGSTAYVLVPKEKRMKLDTHSHKGIMIGYGGGMNQYKVWDLTTDDIIVSRDVVPRLSKERQSIKLQQPTSKNLELCTTQSRFYLAHRRPKSHSNNLRLSHRNTQIQIQIRKNQKRSTLKSYRKNPRRRSQQPAERQADQHKGHQDDQAKGPSPP